MRRLFLLACLATAPLSPGRADDCANAMVQSDMNACADKAFRKTDAELNAAYAQIQRRLKDDPDTAKLMVAAQRAWIAFRDAECLFSSSAERGGSIYPMVYSGCVDRLTHRRLDDLKAFLKCGDGDMSCPVPSK